MRAYTRVEIVISDDLASFIEEASKRLDCSRDEVFVVSMNVLKKLISLKENKVQTVNINEMI